MSEESSYHSEGHGRGGGGGEEYGDVILTSFIPT